MASLYCPNKSGALQVASNISSSGAAARPAVKKAFSSFRVILVSNPGARPSWARVSLAVSVRVVDNARRSVAVNFVVVLGIVESKAVEAVACWFMPPGRKSNVVETPPSRPDLPFCKVDFC